METLKLDGVIMVNRQNNARRYSESVAEERRKTKIEKAKRKVALSILGGSIVMTAGGWAAISAMIVMLT